MPQSFCPRSGATHDSLLRPEPNDRISVEAIANAGQLYVPHLPIVVAAPLESAIAGYLLDDQFLLLILNLPCFAQLLHRPR